MREYHRTHPWRLSEGGLFIPHAYWNRTETSLSYWDDVGFILNGRRIIVWWRHPRDVYQEQIESQAWEEAGDDPMIAGSSKVAPRTTRRLERQAGARSTVATPVANFQRRSEATTPNSWKSRRDCARKALTWRFARPGNGSA